MPRFETILYLDDMRVPLLFGIHLVKNYEQFVDFIQNHEMPDLISFDHDLAFTHYPLNENNPGTAIPYNIYKEKTGLHCARYIIENKLPIKGWMVHSFNVIGKANIESELRSYSPHTEVKRLVIPYRVPQS